MFLMIQNYCNCICPEIDRNENSKNGKDCSNAYNSHPDDRLDLCVRKNYP